MKRFKDFLLEAPKVAFRYEPNLGDKIAVTHTFLADKSRLSLEEKRMTRRFFNEWRASRGTIPIFEVKHQSSRLKDYGLPYGQSISKHEAYRTLIYGVQIHHKNPSVHLVCVKESYKNAKGEDCNFFNFVRIFNDYNKYYDWLSSMRSK